MTVLSVRSSGTLEIVYLIRFSRLGGNAVHQCKEDAAQDKGHVENHLPQVHFGIAFSRIIRDLHKSF